MDEGRGEEEDESCEETQKVGRGTNTSAPTKPYSITYLLESCECMCVYCAEVCEWIAPSVTKRT